MSRRLVVVWLVLTVLVLAACSTLGQTVGVGPKSLNVYLVLATPSQEPWDNAVLQPLKKAQTDGKISLTIVENLGYDGKLEVELRRIAQTEKPDAIFGDAFGNEEAVRRVAKDFPGIPFAFGSGLGPVSPNLSVFDNWIHEPGYLAGMLAGGVTKTNKIGVVAAMPIPEVNRIVNAFITGAHETNPNAAVKVIFINNFFDLLKAREATQALVSAGSDVLFGERDGVIEVASEHNLVAIGNMQDQNSVAPGTVLTSLVWDMSPTVDYVLKQIMAHSYTAQDLKDFSMMGEGGASLASYHGLEARIPPDILAKVKQKEADIRSGLFRVDINEAPPPQ